MSLDDGIKLIGCARLPLGCYALSWHKRWYTLAYARDSDLLRVMRPRVWGFGIPELFFMPRWRDFCFSFRDTVGISEREMKGLQFRFLFGVCGNSAAELPAESWEKTFSFWCTFCNFLGWKIICPLLRGRLLKKNFSRGKENLINFHETLSLVN